MPTSYVIRRNVFHVPQLDEVRYFKYGFFFLQKHMDLL